MKEKTFDEKVENIYVTLSDEQKAEYKHKEETFNKSFLVVGIILAIIFVAIIIGSSVWLIIEKNYGLLAFVVVFGAICVLIGVWIIKSSHTALTATDEIKIKIHIDRLEKQKQYKAAEQEKQLQKNPYYRLAVDKIKSVFILDSYTEVSDKLHAVLNYQEIMQTRIYKFKVNYIDGNSKVVTAAENSEEYNILMPKVSSSDSQVSAKADNIDKIRKYKQLLDDGIITQEEFDAKKKELL